VSAPKSTKEVVAGRLDCQPVRSVPQKPAKRAPVKISTDDFQHRRFQAARGTKGRLR
jgi:hypothetical protein